MAKCAETSAPFFVRGYMTQNVLFKKFNSVVELVDAKQSPREKQGERHGKGKRQFQTQFHATSRKSVLIGD